jgi:DNA-directed RNA polymerase specialized sigma24 family protein
VIEYAVPSSDPDSDDYHVISVSFIDLKEGVEDLPPRKKEAFFYRVILDKKQREVADIMQISMVSVGQYVKDSLIKLSKHYFGEDCET